MALVEKGAHGLRISAVNAPARAAGVVIGAALPDARAALPALAVRPAEAGRDQTALAALAGWLGRYGPSTNVDGADGAWVDVTGVPHLFGGEAALCADLANRLGRLGVTSRIGLADTFGAAHALARFAENAQMNPWTIAAPGEVKGVLAPLPVAALRLAPEAVRLLVRLGLKRVGQLYGLPRAALATRFREARRSGSRKSAETAAASLLLRLDQALGISAEPLRPLHPPPGAVSRLAFPEPLLTSDGVRGALGHLAGMLAARLAFQGLGARRFRLSLYRTDGTVARSVVGTSVSCRDPTHICRLMAERLANVDAGFGVDVATLEAGHLEPLLPHQIGLAAARQATGDPAALVDRLTGRLGQSRVCIWSATASHIPERAGLWKPVMDDGPPSGMDGAAGDPVVPPASAVISALRPPLLLPRPEPISVVAEVPEGAPHRFVWRRLARRVLRSEGPERIAPEWWRNIGAAGRPSGTRDYYRLEDTTGARYWVFREGCYGGGEEDAEDEVDETIDRGEPTGPRWFLHGLFA